MSVEEARRPIEEKLNWLAEKIAMSSSQPKLEIAEALVEDTAAIDDLILEVQAAMPCEYYIREWDGAGLLKVCRRSHDPCRSCTARAKLAEKVTA